MPTCRASCLTSLSEGLGCTLKLWASSCVREQAAGLECSRGGFDLTAFRFGRGTADLLAEDGRGGDAALAADATSESTASRSLDGTLFSEDDTPLWTPLEGVDED